MRLWFSEKYGDKKLKLHAAAEMAHAFALHWIDVKQREGAKLNDFCAYGAGETFANAHVFLIHLND